MRESEDYFGENNRYVKELKPEDFDITSSWILRNRSGEKVNGMVLFYAPWCGYCKKVKNDWLEAAKSSGFCDFYAFNCEKHKNHMLKIKEDMPKLIDGFPSIVIYKDGVPDDYYTGGRSAPELVAACMKMCSGGKCKKKF
jgi:thiol-disulfide isomerase/thioredoxin